MTRQYIRVENDLKRLLNHKGRSKKGFNSQEVFISLLQEFKEGFGMELSTKFLMGLMKKDKKRTFKQKNQKIRDLTRGLSRELVKRYWRGVETMNYRTEIKIYEKTDEPLYPPIADNTNKEIMDAETEFKGIYDLLNFEVEHFKKKKLNSLKSDRQKNRDNHNSLGGAFLKEIRVHRILKDFFATQSETMNLIKI